MVVVTGLDQSNDYDAVLYEIAANLLSDRQRVIMEE